MPDIILEYQGDGQQHIMGVPARDLTEADVLPVGTEVRDLMTHGLYKLAAGLTLDAEPQPEPDAEPDDESEVDDESE